MHPLNIATISLITINVCTKSIWNYDRRFIKPKILCRPLNDTQHRGGPENIKAFRISSTRAHCKLKQNYIVFVLQKKNPLRWSKSFFPVWCSGRKNANIAWSCKDPSSRPSSHNIVRWLQYTWHNHVAGCRETKWIESFTLQQYSLLNDLPAWSQRIWFLSDTQRHFRKTCHGHGHSFWSHVLFENLDCSYF